KFRVSVFLVFLVMALVLIAQTNARPVPTPTKSCRLSCPACATAKPIHCDIACVEICD
ncbi:10442_t:CDS:2, partial [Dentiscutata erythropus]